MVAEDVVAVLVPTLDQETRRGLGWEHLAVLHACLQIHRSENSGHNIFLNKRFPSPYVTHLQTGVNKPYIENNTRELLSNAKFERGITSI